MGKGFWKEMQSLNSAKQKKLRAPSVDANVLQDLFVSNLESASTFRTMVRSIFDEDCQTEPSTVLMVFPTIEEGQPAFGILSFSREKIEDFLVNQKIAPPLLAEYKQLLDASQVEGFVPALMLSTPIFEGDKYDLPENFTYKLAGLQLPPNEG